MSEGQQPQDPQGQFELIEFEEVEAAPGTSLLRISGRPGQSMPGGGLTLLIEAGGEVHRHEQLPALPGPPGLLRAAFSAPREHVDAGATYSLELPDGRSVALPAPTSRQPALGGAGGSLLPAVSTGVGAPPRADSARLLEAERLAESRRLAIGELERRLEGERERRTAAESELSALRNERDQARADRDAALADREAAIEDRDHAEARAKASAASAGALEAQLRAAADAATRTQVTLETQLSDRTAELERVRAVAEEAQARAHASRREATELDERLAHAQAQITVMQKTVDEREAEHAKELENARARSDGPQAQAEEAQAMRRRNAELESTLAELDAALATRAAEIELLREALGAGRAASAGGANGSVTGEILTGDASAVLAAEVELLRAQVQEHRERAQRSDSEAQAALARARAAEEALVATTAQSALTREALALEAARARD